MTRTTHSLSRAIAILGGSVLALCAIIAAGMGTVVLLVGLGSVRAAGAPVRRLRRPAPAVVRSPVKARPAAHVEPAL
jgi:hypothetical protein